MIICVLAKFIKTADLTEGHCLMVFCKLKTSYRGKVFKLKQRVITMALF